MGAWGRGLLLGLVEVDQAEGVHEVEEGFVVAGGVVLDHKRIPNGSECSWQHFSCNWWRGWGNQCALWSRVGFPETGLAPWGVVGMTSVGGPRKLMVQAQVT